jgi:hypothetical protein
MKLFDNIGAWLIEYSIDLSWRNSDTPDNFIVRGWCYVTYNVGLLLKQ